MSQEVEDTVTRVPPEKNRGGKWVRLGDEEYRIPPLSFGAIKDLQDMLPILDGMTGFPTEKQLDVISKIIHLAVSRNYPSMTHEDVFSALDLGNYREIFDAVMALSGYTTGTPGEMKATSP